MPILLNNPFFNKKTRLLYIGLLQDLINCLTKHNYKFELNLKKYKS